MNRKILIVSDGKHKVEEAPGRCYQITVTGLTNQFFVYKDKYDWSLTENSTGMNFCRGDTRKHAIERAEQIAAKVGQDEVNRVVIDLQQMVTNDKIVFPINQPM